MNEEEQNLLGKNKNVVTKIGKSLKLINLFRKVYNLSCRSCQNKILYNPRMSIDNYCPRCQKRLKPILSKKTDIEKEELK